MDQFLKEHKLPQTQHKIDHLNSPITIKEIAFVILKHPQNEIFRLRQLHKRILLNISGRLNTDFAQSFSKNRRGLNFQIHFMKLVLITLTPKPDKGSKIKKVKTKIPCEYR